MDLETYYIDLGPRYERRYKILRSITPLRLTPFFKKTAKIVNRTPDGKLSWICAKSRKKGTLLTPSEEKKFLLWIMQCEVI
jgi:hypothetical protein